jgi:hypothetical protein
VWRALCLWLCATCAMYVLWALCVLWELWELCVLWVLWELWELRVLFSLVHSPPRSFDPRRGGDAPWPCVGSRMVATFLCPCCEGEPGGVPARAMLSVLSSTMRIIELTRRAVLSSSSARNWLLSECCEAEDSSGGRQHTSQ